MDVRAILASESEQAAAGAGKEGICHSYSVGIKAPGLPAILHCNASRRLVIGSQKTPQPGLFVSARSGSSARLPLFPPFFFVFTLVAFSGK